VSPTAEVLGRYGPATAEIERLVTRLENLTHSDWREIVAYGERHPASSADQQRLVQAVADAHVSRESERAVAMMREVVAAASSAVTMDPALDPMPLSRACAVMSDVVLTLAAGSDLDVVTRAAFWGPLETLVPPSKLSAASGYGTGGQAAGLFIEGLARLDRAGWRRVEARRLRETRDQSGTGAALRTAMRDATLAFRHQLHQEARLAASADARAAAARSWDQCYPDGQDAGERGEILGRAQLAGGCLAVGQALPKGTCETLCSLFAGVVDLPVEMAGLAGRAGDEKTDRLFVRSSRELGVPYGALEARLRVPGRLWAVVVGAREHGGRANLKVGFGAGFIRVARRVSLEVGTVICDQSQTIYSMTWSAVGWANILPGFDGRLVVRARDASHSEVIIEGDYQPPLGLLGRLLDHRLVHRVAEATLEDLVTRVVAALVEA